MRKYPTDESTPAEPTAVAPVLLAEDGTAADFAAASAEARRGGRMAILADEQIPDLPEGVATVVNVHLEIDASPAAAASKWMRSFYRIQEIENPVIKLCAGERRHLAAGGADSGKVLQELSGSNVHPSSEQPSAGAQRIRADIYPEARLRRTYRFAPHFPITMRELNNSIPDGISDHAPITVDPPLTTLVAPSKPPVLLGAFQR